jgi:RHS repeat-associated protein
MTSTFSYAYDLAGHLTEVQVNGVTVSTYTYDSNGNRLTRTTPGGTMTYIYDDQDRLTTANAALGTQSFVYTANGDLLTKTTGGQTTTYQYDELGNLLQVTLPSGTSIEYVSDGRNRRIGKKVNGALVQGFLYVGELRPVAQLDGSNNVVSRFVYASGDNVPDYLIKGGTVYRIITDQLGSPRLVVEAMTGQVLQQLDYDEFGRVITDTNPGFQPFGFAGGLYDSDTQLVRFGARDYDPETGRWTAKDPILFAGKQTNLYTYVGNDPVNFRDPTGKVDWKAILIKVWEYFSGEDGPKPPDPDPPAPPPIVGPGPEPEPMPEPDPCEPEEQESSEFSWGVLAVGAAIAAAAITVDILFPPAAIRHAFGSP